MVSRAREALRLFARGTERRPQHALVSTPNAVLVDDAVDTAWAHDDPAIDGIVHVFHQEWESIRAAAAYLPGRKVAVSVEARLSLQDLQAVLEVCAGATAVVLHSWSENMTLIARALREVLGASPRIVAVWHGGTSRFVNQVDVRRVRLLTELQREGVVDRLASVKPDMHLAVGAFEPEALLNVGPRVRPPKRQRRGLEAALVPAALDENFHTNVFACSAAGLRSLYVTALRSSDYPFKLECELHHVPRPSRAELLTLLAEVDVVVNVALSECQPMSALEALALRVPCLTRPLALGALDDHPYQSLVQVAAADTIGPLVHALRTLGEVLQDPSELWDLMNDYEHTLLREAVRRYERIIS